MVEQVGFERCCMVSILTEVSQADSCRYKSQNVEQYDRQKRSIYHSPFEAGIGLPVKDVGQSESFQHERYEGENPDHDPNNPSAKKARKKKK